MRRPRTGSAKQSRAALPVPRVRFVPLVLKRIQMVQSKGRHHARPTSPRSARPEDKPCAGWRKAVCQTIAQVFISGTVDRGRSLKAVGAKHEIHRYDAAHAFANERSAGYDVACANQAWDRMSAFLQAQLD